MRLSTAVALLIAGCSAAAEPASTTSTPIAAEGSTTRTTQEASCLNAATTPFRSRYSETPDGYASQVLREVHGDTAQWVLTYPLDDAGLGGRARSHVIIEDEAWQLTEEGWQELPVVPLRWPLMPWINGYVTGAGVAGSFEAVGRDAVAGIPVTIYEGGIAEMTEAFPGKMRGREFVAESTSYKYWVDDCGDLLRAEVVIDLAGEERAIAVDMEIPTVYRYEYVVYDVGAEVAVRPPQPGGLPEIPNVDGN